MGDPAPARAPGRAAILAIGDELVLGQRLDTNSRWIAQQLARRGWLAGEHATLGDDEAAIARAIVRLAERVGLIITTGGLGPTADDLTRSALAAAMGQRLDEDAEALEQVRSYFQARGRDMPPANRVQALRPEGARCLDNAVGTAPGLAARVGRAEVFCLPGPPAEMRAMYERLVAEALGEGGGEMAFAALHTVGMGESDVAARLGELMDRDRTPLVGTTASGGVVSVRIGADGGAGCEAIERTASEVRRRLGAVVFGEGETSLEAAVVGLLGERGQTLATAESCTGGMLGEWLTGVVGVSRAFAGGWVTYTNEMKHRELGVPEGVFERHGAVSRECAEAMAAGGLSRSGASHCLSITGIAGPGGGSPEKPVGTVWIGLASDGREAAARCFRFPGDRGAIRRWSVVSALATLRLRLIGYEMDLLFERSDRAQRREVGP